jgi:hypothetical protein
VRELNTLWAFPLHVYLYKNYNPNHKWEITILKTLHDLEDQGVMSLAIMSHISNKYDRLIIITEFNRHYQL